MSKHPHSPATRHNKAGHGTVKSYVFGYLLSLILTATAYYLVENQSVRGKKLLATILTLAVFQMLVQIFFFLHLGRGPKPAYNVTFFVATVALILVVVLGSIFIMDNLHYNMTPADVTKNLAQDEAISQIGGEETGACKEILENHKVTISGGIVTPLDFEARQCDTLTFINNDEEVRDIDFGSNHENYSGEDLIVRKGRPETITLNKSGEFLFHDYQRPTVNGTFTVTP